MIISAFLAMASLTAAPVKAKPTVSPSQWVLNSDIPKSEWKRAATTTFDLVVSETGRPVKCDIIIASGSEILDKTVCASAMKRARFKPARDVSGSPTLSVWRDRVAWQPTGDGYNRWYDAPDIVVSTDHITDKKTKMTTVIIAIDDKGRPEQCFIAKSSKTQALDERACEIARNAEISAPITNENGVTVRGIRSFFVGFKSGPGSDVILK
jgi:TonB family protein